MSKFPEFENMVAAYASGAASQLRIETAGPAHAEALKNEMRHFLEFLGPVVGQREVFMKVEESVRGVFLVFSHQGEAEPELEPKAEPEVEPELEEV